MVESVRYIVPSVFTLGALLSGLTAVRLASEEKFDTSVMLIIVAAVLDGLDGHVARYLGACTAMGFELDSLCDLANFGLTPALVVYFWARTLPADGDEHRRTIENVLLWPACCLYAACCVLRLARFNVAGHAEQMQSALPEKRRRASSKIQVTILGNLRRRGLYFKGVPAPVGAAYSLTPLMVHYSTTTRVVGRLGCIVTLVVTALLMVSSVPTLSSKMLKTYRDDSHLQSQHFVSGIAKAVFGLSFCVSVVYYPFDVLLLMNSLHLASIPFGVVMYRFAPKQKGS